MQDAWRRGQELKIHGWIYDIHDGLIQDLGVSVSKVGAGASKLLKPAGPAASRRLPRRA